MTPGKAGGYEAEVGFHSPAGGDTKYVKYRRLRGSPILNRLPTPSAAADGVIIVFLLRSKIFLLTDHCL